MFTLLDFNVTGLYICVTGCMMKKRKRGYAERLEQHADKGECDLPETYDNKKVFENKIKILDKYIKKSKSVVVITGKIFSKETLLRCRYFN